MFSRFWTNVIMLMSLAVLAGVGYYFVREYRGVNVRQRLLTELNAVAKTDGACAALERVRALPQPLHPDVRRGVETRRKAWAAQIVGGNDPQGQAALLGADAEGLIGKNLCEAIALVHADDEVHPVLELLRFTREGGDPCQDPQGLSTAVRALGSHRRVMLHALMARVDQLHCVPAWLSAELADIVLDELGEQPDAFDDLEHLRVAGFLTTWSPVAAAQWSCLVETDGRASRLAGAIGCTPYHKRYVLPLYRALRPLPATGELEGLPAGTEVHLLDQRGELCTVRTTGEPARATTLGCADLSLLSDVHVAALIEQVAFGLAKASLVAGVVTYDGATRRVTPTTKEPELGSWYGYDKSGEPLGMTQTVRIRDLAEKYGEDVPDNPLRAFCRQSGARYCYDVDWAQVVGVLRGDPVVYLSRPMRVFLVEVELPSSELAADWQAAFGHASGVDVAPRAFRLERGGLLLVEASSGGLELRWRLGPDGPFAAQRFGTGEGGRAPPSARLVSAMDLERDGRPELLLQRITRELKDGKPVDAVDEVVLVSLDPGGKHFGTLNRLTVHEY